MIRYLLTSFVLILWMSSAAQQVRVVGIFKTSNSSVSYPQVIINDTLQRFSKKYLQSDERRNEEKFKADQKQYEKLFKDSTVIVHPDDQNRFSISADLKDSVIFTAFQHYTQRYAVSDLLKKHTISITLKKIPCIPYEECDTPSQKIYVFIGEKISVEPAKEKFYCNVISMDDEYDAKYKVIKNIYGDYKGDSIKFTAYDHYGKPPFSNYKYVMLFVTEYCGKLIHEKYQYFNVYPTENGRWASPGNPWRFDRPDTTARQGELIPFGNLKFDKYLDERNQKIRFSSPYFKVDGNVVEPLMGAYVEDLFEIKKKSTLKARGFVFTTSK